MESILETGQAGTHVYGTSIIRSPSNLDDSGLANDSLLEAVIETKVAAPKKTKKPKVASSGLTTKAKKPTKKTAKTLKAMKQESLEDETPYCPDWTELISTLEFSPGLTTNAISLCLTFLKENKQVIALTGWVIHEPSSDTIFSSFAPCNNFLFQSRTLEGHFELRFVPFKGSQPYLLR